MATENFEKEGLTNFRVLVILQGYTATVTFLMTVILFSSVIHANRHHRGDSLTDPVSHNCLKFSGITG